MTTSTDIASAAADEFPTWLKWFLIITSTGTGALATKQLFDPVGALKALAKPSLHFELDRDSDMRKLVAGVTRWCGCFFLVFSMANFYMTTLKLSEAKPLMRVMGVAWLLDALVVKLVGFHMQGPDVFNKGDALGGGSFDFLTGLLLLKKGYE